MVKGQSILNIGILDIVCSISRIVLALMLIIWCMCITLLNFASGEGGGWGVYIFLRHLSFNLGIKHLMCGYLMVRYRSNFTFVMVDRFQPIKNLVSWLNELLQFLFSILFFHVI